jgi:hypothetical protein
MFYLKTRAVCAKFVFAKFSGLIPKSYGLLWKEETCLLAELSISRDKSIVLRRGGKGR